MMRSLPYGIMPMTGGRRGAGLPHPPAPFHEGHPTLAEGGKPGVTTSMCRLPPLTEKS
jgi:hypothetical protein